MVVFLQLAALALGILECDEEGLDELGAGELESEELNRAGG